MSEMQPEDIKAEAEAAAEQGKDLHARVRDLVLRAMRDRAVSVGEVTTVVRAAAEGVSIGLEKHAGEVKMAAHAAWTGLDEAVKKSAEATKLAAQQLMSQGKEFKDSDLKPAFDELKQLEESLLSTVSQVAERAGGRVKSEFLSQVEHARRTGTDTGRLVGQAWTEFSQRMGSAAKGGATEGASAATELKKRLTLVASGILAGMADALRDKADGGKK